MNPCSVALPGALRHVAENFQRREHVDHVVERDGAVGHLVGGKRQQVEVANRERGTCQAGPNREQRVDAKARIVREAGGGDEASDHDPGALIQTQCAGQLAEAMLKHQRARRQNPGPRDRGEVPELLAAPTIE